MTTRKFIRYPAYLLGSVCVLLSTIPAFCQNSPSYSGAVEISDTCNLRIYYPDYSRIDLACGDMPPKYDGSVIFVCAAAFTGSLRDTFSHDNIAGDHVSNGKRYKGYSCERNNGAFVYYNDKPKFIYEAYSDEFDKAASNGGCGFAQEMMVHNGGIVKHTRPDSNANKFRALCLINDRLAIADSKDAIKFGDFIANLLKGGATEAIYLDMGVGWNYSWYRNENGDVCEIHPVAVATKYATNWVTFYK